jgi:putative peptidoglycan lipid II flippase
MVSRLVSMSSVSSLVRVDIERGMVSRTRAILSSTAWFGALSLLPKVFSLFKDVAVAASFGASHALDTYLIAFVLIGVPVSIVVVAMQTTLIPALVNKDNNAAAGLLGGAIKLAVVLLILALPIWLAVLPAVFGTLYPNTAGNNKHDLLWACLWLIPYYFINGINLLLYGALQARKVFWPNAVLPGMFPIAILAAVWLMPVADIHSLLIGTVAGSVLEGIALIFVLMRERLLRLWHTAGFGLMPVVRLALPLMAGGAIASFAPVVEQLIAFRLGPGAVSLLTYGNKVPAAVNSLLLTSIGIVVLPHFAELLAKREWHSCKKLYIRLSVIALGAGILVAGVGMTLSETIISLLFERGAFTTADTRESAAVMSAYLLQLPFLLVAMVSMRALVAMGKTLAMTWMTAGQLIMAGSLAYLFSSHYGVLGVASGTAAAALFGAAILSTAAWHGFNEQSRNLAT